MTAVVLPIRSDGNGLSSPLSSDGTRVTTTVDLSGSGEDVLEYRA